MKNPCPMVCLGYPQCQRRGRLPWKRRLPFGRCSRRRNRKPHCHTMKPRVLHSLPLALFASLTISASAAPLGTAITYQGRLNDGPNPANGSYDLRFTVFDVPEYGFPVGPVLTNSGVMVSDGLFQAELDFGDGVFTNSSRLWLELGVRKSGGSYYTALVPHQPFTPAPYALYAPNAGTAASAVSAQTVAAGSVGLAGLDTASVDTRYVNKTGDTMTGRLTLPADGLSVGADQLFTTPQGNIGIGTNGPAARLHVAGDLRVDGVIRASGQQYYTLGGEAFFPTVNVNYTNLPGMARGAFIALGSGTMVAPVHLPHGAVITEFRAYYTDNSTADLYIVLRAREFTDPHMMTNYEMASFSTYGTSGNTNQSTTQVSWNTVDNQNRSYVVVASSSAWSPDLRIVGALVGYTINTVP